MATVGRVQIRDYTHNTSFQPLLYTLTGTAVLFDSTLDASKPLSELVQYNEQIDITWLSSSNEKSSLNELDKLFSLLVMQNANCSVMLRSESIIFVVKSKSQ